MAMQHAVLFVLVAACVAVAIARGRSEPVLALIFGAAAFGILAGLSTGEMGKSFGNGFGVAAGGTGLAVVAGTLIGAMAAGTRVPGFAKAAPLAGLVAGLGASPAAAFALLRPLAEAMAADPVRLALAVSIGQGLLLPSPVMVAATTILGADWRLVLAIGAPCALVLAFAAGLLRRTAPLPIAASACPALPAVGLVVVSVVVTGLLITAALGDIPSEPFGGGGARELLLGLGRPLILLLVGVSAMAAFSRRSALVGTAHAAIGRAAPLVLLLGAAGGVQAMGQESRMGDGVAEALAGGHWGLLVPFGVACALKILSGSSLVAAISAAGLLQPALAGLGLDDSIGRACAALAVGAGAMAGAHVNDGLFWLVRDAAGRRGMAWFFGGTLLQGFVAVAILSAVHAAVLAF